MNTNLSKQSQYEIAQMEIHIKWTFLYDQRDFPHLIEFL
jgi:hypothetical protein